MSQPMYFVEGVQRLGLEQVHKLGLRYAFPETVYCGEFTGQGPGGTQGCLICTSGDRLAYFAAPDRQTWLQIPPRDLTSDKRVFVGMWNEERPKPDELKAPSQLHGRFVKLRDGNEWLIPIARAWSDAEGNEGWENRLPARVTLGADGEWTVGDVESRYKAIWKYAVAWWEGLWKSTPDENNVVRFDFAGSNDAGTTMLACNYRVWRAEVALLGLFDSQFLSVREVMDAAIDYGTYIAWAKKNISSQEAVSDSLPLTDGAAAEIPATAPR